MILFLALLNNLWVNKFSEFNSAKSFGAQTAKLPPVSPNLPVCPSDFAENIKLNLFELKKYQ